MAVISLGGIVTSLSVRVGGDELDNAIINYVKKEYSLMLGERTAEEIKLELGSAYPLQEEEQVEGALEGGQIDAEVVHPAEWYPPPVRTDVGSPAGGGRR